jgi:hypothetical protein
MIAAPARAELRPGAIFHPGRDIRHLPVGVHHVVLPSRLERRAHPEACLALERSGQTRLLVHQGPHRQVQHRHFHPARDIDADGVRDHRFTRGQDAADRQPIPHVRIGHQRARH